MPPEEYSPLQQLLLDPDLHVVKALADVCHLDRVPLANSLLRIFRYIQTFFSYVTSYLIYLYIDFETKHFLGMKGKRQISYDH